MKLFLCVFLIILSALGRVSNNLEITNRNFLEEDLIKSDPCHRPCKSDEKPKRCHFIFNVQTTYKDSKLFIAINDSVPGPPINVCLNDIVVIEVKNKIPGQDLAIHWNGIDQVGTPFMDGVPMITQCPIFYGSTYKYAFRASKPGTFFYHAHSVSHHSDGVFGAINVGQPSPFGPHSDLYDFDDRCEQNTLLMLMSATFPKLLTGSLDDLSKMKPIGLEINSADDNRIMLNGLFNNLKLINAVAINCPLTVSINNHYFTIISTDNFKVDPKKWVKKVILYPGEKMDVVVTFQEPGEYWIDVDGLEDCRELKTRVEIQYSAGDYTSTIPEVEMPLSDDFLNEIQPPISGQMLQSPENETNNNVSIVPIYLNIDRVDVKEIDNDFRYISDIMPQKVLYPFALSSSVVQINGKNFLYPNVPILTQAKDVSKYIVCQVGAENKHNSPQCVLTIEGTLNEIIELILINEGKYSDDSYTFHIHGLKMQVLSTSVKGDSKLSKEDFIQLHNEGKIPRNLVNPPLKDTVNVPNKGYTIVRIKLDNPGAWMLECRSCSLSALPTAVLINVRQNIPKSVIRSLPKCGNYRPPDVLLN